MAAAQLIHEIDCLPPTQLAEVVRHIKKLEKIPKLSPAELGLVIDQFIDASDEGEAELLPTEASW